MKAILLAGGLGSRLYPVTMAVSKQLLPVYDKPMVFYPLSVIILAGIREVMIISTKNDIDNYERLLGDGTNYGINLQYKIQDEPNGIAEAFLIGEEFIGNDPVCLILGDNIFYGLKFSKRLEKVVARAKIDNKAIIFGYKVNDPSRYGVIEYDNGGNVISIEEKPIKPKSNNAVVGLYFYPSEVISVVKKIKPSHRGELEITSINKYFLNKERLVAETLGPGFTWLDTGTHESLLEASQFIETIEKRQGIKVGCLEEIAFEKGFITIEQLLNQAKVLKGTSYGDYLTNRYG